MNSLDITALARIRYEERLRAAEQRHSWRTSEWFRKLPKLAQLAVTIFS
jgi:hypothetical protein